MLLRNVDTIFNYMRHFNIDTYENYFGLELEVATSCFRLKKWHKVMLDVCSKMKIFGPYSYIYSKYTSLALIGLARILKAEGVQVSDYPNSEESEKFKEKA